MKGFETSLHVLLCFEMKKDRILQNLTFCHLIVKVTGIQRSLEK